MEASYCMIAPQAKRKSMDDDDDDSLDMTENMCERTSTNATNCLLSAEQENTTLNATTNIHDLKKNLANEEEFSSINHSEPIHIFLKMKPLSAQEQQKQQDQVTLTEI